VGFIWGLQKTYSYTPFNKVARVNYINGYEDFYYDEGETLIKKEYQNGKVTYYIGNSYEASYQETPNGLQESMKHYVKADGKLVAIHEKTVVGTQKQPDKTAYIHRDILDSVDMVTDSHGKIVLRNSYTPYGEKIESDGESDSTETTLFSSSELRGYTGHKEAADSELIDMNARLYDPVIARFISPDTMVAHPDMIQSYNRYTYVYGNPLKYNDPSGHFANFIIGAIIFAIGATTDESWGKLAMMVGRVMMMNTSLGFETALAQGATVGFTTGVISSGGNLGQSIVSAVQGGLQAQVSFEIGHGGEGGEALFGKGFNTNLAHGLSGGLFTMMRGGKFEEGFTSGVVGSMVGGMLKEAGLDYKQAAHRLAGAMVNAIAGGLSAKATGGDFNEGAMNAMIVYLFNEFGKNFLRKPDDKYSSPFSWKRTKNSVSASNKQMTHLASGAVKLVDNLMADMAKGFKGGLEGYREVRDNSPWYAKSLLKVSMTATELGATSWISWAKNPITYIWYNSFSGAYFDTYEYTNRISFFTSTVVDISEYDNKWFE
jgi:RHS repeat-associated protein